MPSSPTGTTSCPYYSNLFPEGNGIGRASNVLDLRVTPRPNGIDYKSDSVLERYSVSDDTCRVHNPDTISTIGDKGN